MTTYHEQEITVHIGVDIGCLECGEPSAVVAVNTDRAKVNRALTNAKRRQKKTWTGQHEFELFSLPLKLKIPLEDA